MKKAPGQFLQSSKCPYTYKGIPEYLKTSDNGIIFKVGINAYPLEPLMSYFKVDGDWNYITPENEIGVYLDSGEVFKSNGFYKNGFDYPTQKEINFYKKHAEQ